MYIVYTAFPYFVIFQSEHFLFEKPSLFCRDLGCTHSAWIIHTDIYSILCTSLCTLVLSTSLCTLQTWANSSISSPKIPHPFRNILSRVDQSQGFRLYLHTFAVHTLCLDQFYYCTFILESRLCPTVHLVVPAWLLIL